MLKFPHSPGAKELARLTPGTCVIPRGTRLARVYYTAGRHPIAWNAFRYIGPVNSRWGIYLGARDARGCLAEAFQQTRRIDRAFWAPWLAVFEIVSPLLVLDLTGDFATHMGASMAIHSGNRACARDWARDLYEAYEDIQGIQYSAPRGAAALSLNERALRLPLFAAHPLLHRALADDLMLDPLKHAAQELGYALR